MIDLCAGMALSPEGLHPAGVLLAPLVQRKHVHYAIEDLGSRIQ